MSVSVRELAVSHGPGRSGRVVVLAAHCGARSKSGAAICCLGLPPSVRAVLEVFKKVCVVSPPPGKCFHFGASSGLPLLGVHSTRPSLAAHYDCAPASLGRRVPEALQGVFDGEKEKKS